MDERVADTAESTHRHDRRSVRPCSVHVAGKSGFGSFNACRVLFPCTRVVEYEYDLDRQWANASYSPPLSPYPLPRIAPSHLSLDGAHQFESDWTYQVLEATHTAAAAPNPGGGPTPLYGVACFRNRADATQKRGALQFSMLLVSFEPHFDFFKPFLEVATAYLLDRLSALNEEEYRAAEGAAAREALAAGGAVGEVKLQTSMSASAIALTNEVLGTLYYAINEGFRHTALGEDVRRGEKGREREREGETENERRRRRKREERQREKLRVESNPTHPKVRPGGY